jgi:hypothetical protein
MLRAAPRSRRYVRHPQPGVPLNPVTRWAGRTGAGRVAAHRPRDRAPQSTDPARPRTAWTTFSDAIELFEGGAWPRFT